MDIAKRRALILDELLRSFEERRFTLAYQPIIRVRDSVITAAEALLRWESLGLGVVPPGVFVPLAEECGLAVKLGEWVMRDACSQNRLWQTLGIARLRLHLNVTHTELRSPGFASLLASICNASGLSPGDIALEIADMSKLVADTAAFDAMCAVRELGCSIVADDVGDELVDRAWLESMPVDMIKLNRGFVSSLPGDEIVFRFAERVVGAVRRRGLKVMALGVETQAEWRAVGALECDETQGYYFGSPMETNRFTSLLFESGCALSVREASDMGRIASL
jgi:EAL domain-containing protein (putative c-di-GMP-specific phosphodiesterase class I)